MSRIENTIRRLLPGKVIVAGDLNAKSVIWGSQVTNVRGEVLADWATSLNLICLNKGVAHSCVRQWGGSIVDITFASPEVSRLLEDWWVEENIETLSDHKYVRIDWSDPVSRVQTTTLNSLSRFQRTPHWVLNKLNKNAIMAAAIVITWPENQSWSSGDVNQRANWLCDKLAIICDAGMPRANRIRHVNVYTGGTILLPNSGQTVSRTEGSTPDIVDEPIETQRRNSRYMKDTE